MRENHTDSCAQVTTFAFAVLRPLAIILLFAALPFTLHAAHLIGGEITYRCLGSAGNNTNTYEITINVFRDCASGGSEFDSPDFVVPMNVTVYQGNTEFNTYVLNAPIVEVVDVAGSINNPCVEVPTNICVEQGTYTFVIDLPIVNESYHIVYQRCCRNNTITNIFMPDASGSTYTIELTPTAQSTCNNSPVFREYPPAILCAGQPFLYDFSATDEEGDLLIYEFCSPFLGGGQGPQDDPFGVAPNPDLPPPFDNVVFQAPNYTANVPLGTAAGLTFNPSSGI
ncbi:MAG: hypothetical protein AAGJ82_09875, partial [Bacteroidota bacterium]